VGTDEQTLILAKSLDNHGKRKSRIAGLLSTQSENTGKIIDGYMVLGTIEQLYQVIERSVIDCVVICDEKLKREDIQMLTSQCAVVGIDCIVNLSSMAGKHLHPAIDWLNGNAFLALHARQVHKISPISKRLVDILVSLLAIICSIPLWIIIPILIRRDSAGPAIYVQERVGKGGRLFRMYKFRTMITGAEQIQDKVMHLNEMDGPVFKIRNDPRLTRVGLFLRRTSLDEFPQLFNVLLGNMSLVGPRPPLPQEVAQYRPWQRKRLSIIPGVTCLWQVTGRNEIKFDEWMRLDMQYIENWSLILDFKILIKTIAAVISRRGAL
jgi:exopolysaccharide biosynthesis polyprenyl glycosylphosphotransferase